MMNETKTRQHQHQRQRQGQRQRQHNNNNNKSVSFPFADLVIKPNDKNRMEKSRTTPTTTTTKQPDTANTGSHRPSATSQPRSTPLPFGYYYEYDPASAFDVQCKVNKDNANGEFVEHQKHHAVAALVLEHCQGCGLPPVTETNTTKTTNSNIKKLLACSKCHGAVYHDQNCQRRHWKPSSTSSSAKVQEPISHKTDCKKQAAMLDEFKQMWRFWKDHEEEGIHDSAPNGDLSLSSSLLGMARQFFLAPKTDSSDDDHATATFWTTLDYNWKRGVQQWYEQDYLQAMQVFQQALLPWMKEWEKKEDRDKKHRHSSSPSSSCSKSSTTRTSPPENNRPQQQEQEEQRQRQRRLLSLAQRLLFCAYCELDAPGITLSGRRRLTACLGISLPLLQQQGQGRSPSSSTLFSRDLCQTLQDAWSELILVCEEYHDMASARHLAHWAIQCQQQQQQQLDYQNNINGPQYRFCQWTDPYQRPGYMAPTTTTRTSVFSFFNGHCPRDQHPTWCHILEDKWEGIRNDYLELCQRQKDQCHTSSSLFQKVGSGMRGSGEHDGSVVQPTSGSSGNLSGTGSKGEWTEYILFGTGASEEGNHHVPWDNSLCQFTKQLMRDILSSEAIDLACQGGGEIIFSRLAPHTHIQAHCGPTNLRWTAHLGLIVPQKSSSKSSSSKANPYQHQCHIRVRHDWYTWEPGKVLVFDDSYEHEVCNDTNSERVVLLIRFWNPLLLTKTQRDDFQPQDDCMNAVKVLSRDDYLLEARTKKEQAIDKRYHPPT
jgi:hypothetical protein